MGLLDKNLDKVKDKITGLFNPFSENKGIGDMLGSAFGGLTEAFDGVYDALSGVFKPQFETLEEAEDSLFNEQPAPPAIGSIYESDTHAYDELTSYGDHHFIRGFVRHEFTNRERDFGLHYTHGSGGEAADTVLDDPNDGYEGDVYRGPRSAWVRVCSNALHTDEKTGESFEGFVLHGVTNFEDIYGFGPSGTDSANNILGYDVNGKPHILEEKMFKHRPCPGVVSFESETVEPMHNGRKTTLTITCWSRSQLDYLHPYFLSPGITAVVEWGWNNYPRDVLADLTDLGYSADENPDTPGEASGLVGMYSDIQYSTDHIKKGRGNYMYVIGLMTNFSYSLREDGGYDCQLEITNIGGLAFDQKKKTGKKTCVKKKELSDEKKEEAKEDASDDFEDRKEDFESFIDSYLTSYLDDDDDDKGVDVSYGFGGEYMMKRTKRHVTRGRYFTPDTVKASGTYEMGKKSYYITFGLFLDFVNEFYAKSTFASNGAPATLFEFTCERTRIAAHPNIKSMNGDVLLIPNSTSPRRNGGSSTAMINMLTSDNRGVSRDELQSALIASVAESGKKVDNLAAALKASPRDDLYTILASKAIAIGNYRNYPDYTQDPTTGKLRKSMVREKAVLPFPDYATGSGGYSGRLKDLYVNVETIKDAVYGADKVEVFVMNVLKQMSEAAGGIWEFNFTSASRSTDNCPVTAITDQNYTGITSVDERQRMGEIYTFNAHQKNSIVQSMSLSVDLPGEVASEVIGQAGMEDRSNKTRAFAREAEDRLINADAASKKCGKLGGTFWQSTKEDIEEPDRYIIVKKIEIKVEKSITEWDGVDTKEIKIEMVDTNKVRAEKSMREDKNPKNNVNFNAPVPNVELEIQLLGIAGIRNFDCFNCTGVPTAYYTRGYFVIKQIKDSISDNNWTTTITGWFSMNANEPESKK